MSRRPADAPSLFSDSPASSPKQSAKSSWINAHCDGGARGNPGPAGYGALIQDDKGMVLAELSEFLGIRTNNYAEYSGLLGCLQYALDHHHPRLRVISDSELMVKQIQGKYKVNSSDLKPLWQEARNRIAKLEAFEISHALRHKNKDADRLANEAMDRGMKRPQIPASGKDLSSFGEAGGPASRIEAPPGAPSSRPHLGAKVDSQDISSTPYPNPGTMLRGFTRDGVIHILGNATLPDGIFVKIIRE